MGDICTCAVIRAASLDKYFSCFQKLFEDIWQETFFFFLIQFIYLFFPF